MTQVFVGLFTEGSTDMRFLEHILEKTLKAIALECSKLMEIEVLPIVIDKTGLKFVEQVLAASKTGFSEFCIQIICVHKDGDDTTALNVYQNHINPAKKVLEKQKSSEYCKILAALVPIQEMEAWMLADKELLKKEIGTKKTDSELGFSRMPETIASPKEVIEKAIHVARAEFTKRRRSHLTIADLYLPIGQSIDLKKLSQLDSYQDFKENVREAFRKLNLLH